MYHLKNYMEEIVESLLDDVTKNMKVCTCEKCMTDMMALALNDLPPKYVVTEKGESYSKLNFLRQQFEIDVISAITKAAITVNNKKRHE